VRDYSTLKPSICDSRKLAQAGLLAQILYTNGTTKCDNYGRLEGATSKLQSVVLPALCLFGGITEAQVAAAADALVDVGLWHRYEVNGKVFIEYERYDEEQRPDYLSRRGAKPTFPDPPDRHDLAAANRPHLPPKRGHATEQAPALSPKPTADAHQAPPTAPAPQPQPPADSDERQTLFEWLQRHMPHTINKTNVDLMETMAEETSYAVILRAAEVAVAENKRTWSYVQGVWRRYRDGGCRSYADALASDEQRLNAPARASPKGNGKGLAGLAAELARVRGERISDES
jgi:DnaD/phage-associated family protein